MTDAKHTPGPWRIEDYRSLSDAFWIVAEHPEVGFVSHALVRSGCEEADELGNLEANAHLIAAAPELLACARKSIEPYDALTDDDVRSLYGEEEARLCVETRAAIAKAEGRS